MKSSADLNNHNRYTNGGTTETNGKRLGWWERTIYTLKDDDIFVTVTPATESRPDLIAFQLYGRSNLMWLVLQYNNILDPVTELVAGTKLRLPTQERVNSNGW